MSLDDVRIIDLPRIRDKRGNLSFIESIKHVPFKIERAHWIYDVPGGECRGGHAYRSTHEFIVAMSGSFDVELRDGMHRATYHLNRSYYGLYVPAGVWREMNNFSTNSLALVLSSTQYDTLDYVRDYSHFEELKKENQLLIERKNHNTSSFLCIKGSESSVFDCTMIELSKHTSDVGNLSVVQNLQSIPFEINRTYHLYDVPGGESRGAHAHKELQQLILAVGGSFDVTLDDGCNKRTFSLNNPYHGLLITPGIWRDLSNFSSGATCLVIASHHYDEKDYIRDYNEFKEFKSKQ